MDNHLIPGASSGWWPNKHHVVQCHICGGHAYDLLGQIDCENCGVINASDPNILELHIENFDLKVKEHALAAEQQKSKNYANKHRSRWSRYPKHI